MSVHESFPSEASGGMSDHTDHESAEAATQYAGDVVPILKNVKEEYPGQKGVINSTGDLAQHLNNNSYPYRTGSDRTNVTPLRIGK